MFFIYLVAVALLAYGTTSQALLYPNEYRFRSVLDGIFLRPILNIFGELFLGEVHGYEYDGRPSSDPDSEIYCSDMTNLTELKIELMTEGTIRCPNNHFFVQFVSIVYLFGSNILLLNLLIASFTYSFDKVQKNLSGDMDLWNSRGSQIFDLKSFSIPCKFL